MGFVEHDPEGQADVAAFVQGLGALNWKEGSNCTSTGAGATATAP